MNLPKLEVKTLLGLFVFIFGLQTLWTIINMFMQPNRSIWGWLGTIIGLFFSVIGIFAFYELYKLIPSTSNQLEVIINLSDKEMKAAMEKIE